MVGIDARTGKLAEQTELIKQSIQRALTTPQGTRVLRRDLGFKALDENTECLRPELDDNTIVKLAENDLKVAEPRVEVTKIELKRDGEIVTLIVDYTQEVTPDRVVVVLPIPYVGTIVRLEKDGFGLVKFDRPIDIGESTVDVGVISTSGAAVFSGGAGTNVVNLKEGARVKGTASVDAQKDMASVKTISPSPR